MREIFICVLLLSSIVACSPRGETYSVDQVLQNQKNKYAVAMSEAGDAAELPSVKKIESLLASTCEANDKRVVANSAKEISDSINILIPKAGYTSRAALTEISNQYASTSQNGGIVGAEAKLLAARAYSILASELETTKFKL